MVTQWWYLLLMGIKYHIKTHFIYFIRGLPNDGMEHMVSQALPVSFSMAPWSHPLQPCCHSISMTTPWRWVSQSVHVDRSQVNIQPHAFFIHRLRPVLSSCLISKRLPQVRGQPHCRLRSYLRAGVWGETRGDERRREETCKWRDYGFHLSHTKHTFIRDSLTKDTTDPAFLYNHGCSRNSRVVGCAD